MGPEGDTVVLGLGLLVGIRQEFKLLVFQQRLVEGRWGLDGQSGDVWERRASGGIRRLELISLRLRSALEELVGLVVV